MLINFKRITKDQIRVLHDFYFQSSEPDAPQVLFEGLSLDDKNKVFHQFPVDHCNKEFSNFENIRALTRSQNLASIKGLKSCSFMLRGQVVEDVQPDIIYEEYVYPIRSSFCNS